jgi:uncharacterized membrane protein
MATILVLYVGLGILIVLISLPLLFEKVPPNPSYGFRLPPALDDPRIWYPTNKYSAKWLILAGASAVAAAVALDFVPGITLDVYALGCLAAFAVVMIVGLVQSVRYMRSIATRQDPK